MAKKIILTFSLCLGCILLSSCISAHKTVNFSDPREPRYYGTYDNAAEPATRQTVKIVSYNLALCKDPQGIAAFLKENPALALADILCLQEINSADLKFISGALKCNYIYYPNGIHPENNKDFGPAILSRWPIEEDKKILLPFSFSDRYLKIQRCATLARVSVGKSKVYVVSAHLGVIISPRQRQAQLEAILAELGNAADKCVIAGDFNTYGRIHSEAVKQVLEDAGFKLANERAGWTYKYWYLFNHKAVLDYIFYRGFELVQAGKVSDRRFSDHFPVWAELAGQN